jgi:hypothetical protein
LEKIFNFFGKIAIFGCNELAVLSSILKEGGSNGQVNDIIELSM